jgi:hypothetical protein
MATFVDARDFGVSSGSPDNTASLQSAIDAAWADGSQCVKLVSGLYRMSGPVDISGVCLDGVAISYGNSAVGTGLVLTTSGRPLVTIKGRRGGIQTPGGRLSGLSLFSGPNVKGLYAIVLGDGNCLPDRARLEFLRITSYPVTGPFLGWTGGIFANGDGRASPAGIRGLTIRDVEIFSCSSPAVVLRSITNLRMHAVDMFTGTGNRSVMGMWFSGTPACPISDAQVTNCRCDGPLLVNNSIDSHFDGSFYAGRDFHAPTCIGTTENLRHTPTRIIY